AFVISDTGTVVAACRYLDASVEQIDLPLGLGSRHLAAASISQRLGAIAIVVSESGVVRVFHRGEIEATLIPGNEITRRVSHVERRENNNQHCRDVVARHVADRSGAIRRSEG